jgi:hypothetical protein
VHGAVGYLQTRPCSHAVCNLRPLLVPRTGPTSSGIVSANPIALFLCHFTLPSPELITPSTGHRLLEQFARFFFFLKSNPDLAASVETSYLPHKSPGFDCRLVPVVHVNNLNRINIKNKCCHNLCICHCCTNLIYNFVES